MTIAWAVIGAFAIFFVRFFDVQWTPQRFDIGDRRMMHRIFKSTFDKGAG